MKTNTSKFKPIEGWERVGLNEGDGMLGGGDVLALYDLAETKQECFADGWNRRSEIALLLAEESKTVEIKATTCNAAVAAINFACETEEGIEFLKLWQVGDVEAILRDWPDCPKAVFEAIESIFSNSTTTEEA